MQAESLYNVITNGNVKNHNLGCKTSAAACVSITTPFYTYYPLYVFMYMYIAKDVIVLIE